MTTAHANSPRDAIARVETMCLMAGMDLPESEKVPDPWIETRLPAHVPFVRTLRDGSEVLLGATPVEVGTWIAAGETLVREVGAGLG